MLKYEECKELTRWTGMTTNKPLVARFIAWKSGTDLKLYVSNYEPRSIIKPTYRSTGHWAFVMGTLPRTRFQTRGTGSRARFRTLVMDATLATGLLALSIASLVL